jgi:hypothetical protein
MAADKGKVWVQLYIGEEECGSAFKVLVEATGDIDDLTKAVYQANDKVLGHCNPPQLAVYKAGTDVPPKEEDKLRPGKPVPTDSTDENPLCVLAPAREVNQRGTLAFSILLFPRTFDYISKLTKWELHGPLRLKHQTLKS